jgi:hypothetical protein
VPRLPRLYQSRLLRRGALQEFRRRFVVRILRHKAATDGEVEDGLPQLLDLLGARREDGNVVQRKAHMIGESSCMGIGRVEAGLQAASRDLFIRIVSLDRYSFFLRQPVIRATQKEAPSYTKWKGFFHRQFCITMGSL